MLQDSKQTNQGVGYAQPKVGNTLKNYFSPTFNSRLMKLKISISYQSNRVIVFLTYTVFILFLIFKFDAVKSKIIWCGTNSVIFSV